MYHKEIGDFKHGQLWTQDDLSQDDLLTQVDPAKRETNDLEDEVFPWGCCHFFCHSTSDKRVKMINITMRNHLLDNLVLPHSMLKSTHSIIYYLDIIPL